MRIAGRTWQEVADECGYSNYHVAASDIQGESRRRREKLNETIDEKVALQWDQLARAMEKAQEVLEATHLAHSGGTIVERPVKDSEGNIVLDPRTSEPIMVPLIDHAPTLAAAATIVRVSESMRKLAGLDKPASVHLEHSGGVSYEIVGVDVDKI